MGKPRGRDGREHMSQLGKEQVSNPWFCLTKAAHETPNLRILRRAGAKRHEKNTRRTRIKLSCPSVPGRRSMRRLGISWANSGSGAPSSPLNRFGIRDFYLSYYIDSRARFDEEGQHANRTRSPQEGLATLSGDRLSPGRKRFRGRRS